MKVLLRFLAILATTFFCFAYTSSDSSKCPTPRQVTVTNITDTSALVKWSSVSGISTYQLRLLKLVGANYQEVSIQLVSDTVKTLTNLTPNTNYKVEVRSQCSKGVFSDPASQTFMTGGVIIDDIVFVDGKGPQGTQRCVGKLRSSMNSYTNSVTVNLNPNQAMRVKIMDGRIGGPKGITFSEFVIVSRYLNSPKHAFWTLLHDNCEKNAPSLSSEKTNVFNGNTLVGANLVFNRGNKQFKLNIDRRAVNSVTISSLPQNTYAIVEIYSVL